jgi:hypothetical protein
LLVGLALADVPSARWSVAPSAVQVGEPFELVLTCVENAPASALAGAEPALELDATWAVLEERARPWERTFLLVSLEPGRREIPRGALAAHAIARGLDWAPESLLLDVAPALAAGEDAPRPMRGLRTLPAREVSASLPWTWIGLGAILTGSAIGLVLWRSAARRGGRAASPASDPLDRLERLGAELARAEGDALIVGHHELAGLLRAGSPGNEAPRGGAARNGAAREPARGTALTDEEWMAQLEASGRVPQAERDRCARLLAELARVRFGGERPSSFAVDDAIREARALLLALRSAGATT